MLTGAESGLLHLDLYHTISTDKGLNLLAIMASHGDIAEGGANEEFNDIIKTRSGMFEIVISRLCIMFNAQCCSKRTGCLTLKEHFVVQYVHKSRKETLTEPEILLCVVNLSSHGGKGKRDIGKAKQQKARREQEMVDCDTFARRKRKSQAR